MAIEDASAFHRLHRLLLDEHEQQVKALRQELERHREPKFSSDRDDIETAYCSTATVDSELLIRCKRVETPPSDKRLSVGRGTETSGTNRQGSSKKLSLRADTPPPACKRNSTGKSRNSQTSTSWTESSSIVSSVGPSSDDETLANGAAAVSSMLSVSSSDTDMPETAALDPPSSQEKISRPALLPIGSSHRSDVMSTDLAAPTQAWTSVNPAPPSIQKDALEVTEPPNMPELLGTVTNGESDDKVACTSSMAALDNVAPTRSNRSQIKKSPSEVKPSYSMLFPEMTSALRKFMNLEQSRPQLEFGALQKQMSEKSRLSRAKTMPADLDSSSENGESSTPQLKKRTLPSLPALKTGTRKGSILKKAHDEPAPASPRPQAKRGVSFDVNALQKAEESESKRPTVEIETKFEPCDWWHANQLELLPKKQQQQQAIREQRRDGLTSMRRSMISDTHKVQVANPNALLNFCWDILAMLVVGLDVMVIPMKVFESGIHVAGDSLLWFTTIFWTLDFFHNFFVGYYHQGEVVLEMRRVVKRYAASWLFTDLLTNIVDWIRIISGNVGMTSSSVDNTLYGMHCIRLLRLLKLKRLMKMVEDRITSEYTSNAITIFKLFSSLIMLTHVIACAWYWIGSRSMAEREDSWVQSLEGADLRYKYTTSFHWSLTQFTPASITVQPHNFYERAFAVVVLLCALIVFSSFVSGITGAMMHIRSLQSVKSKQFWLLRRYLNESKVPVPLAIRVQQYVENAYESREVFLKEASVEVLSLLSAQLHRELQTAIYEPRISTHPFMVLIGKIDENSIQEVCSKALTRCSLVRGETTFSVGEVAKKMHFICMGHLIYDIVRGSLHDDEFPRTVQKDDLRENMWVCESVLWTNWTYFGSLSSVTECEVVCLDSELFGAALKNNREVWQEGFHYAKSFVQGLNRVDCYHISDLYVSNLIEGLYFRLFNDYNWKRLYASSVDAETRRTSVGKFDVFMLKRPMQKFINRMKERISHSSRGSRDSASSIASSVFSDDDFRLSASAQF